MKVRYREHSETVWFLIDLMDKYETFKQAVDGESRIPFFVRDFEMRKFKEEVEALYNNKNALRRNMDNSFRSRRVNRNTGMIRGLSHR